MTPSNTTTTAVVIVVATTAIVALIVIPVVCLLQERKKRRRLRNSQLQPIVLLAGTPAGSDHPTKADEHSSKGGKVIDKVRGEESDDEEVSIGT